MHTSSANRAPSQDLGIIDLCRQIDRKVVGKWELKQFPFGWLLVVYRDGGIVDHPLREHGGGEENKAALPWYLRQHEVVGVGVNPHDAARSVLLGNKGARLRARQIAGVGDRRMHLVFVSIDTGEVVWANQLLARARLIC